MFSQSTRPMQAAPKRGKIVPNARARMSSKAAPATTEALAWQQQAVAVYDQTKQVAGATMHSALAQRITELTGRVVAAGTMYVNSDTRLAVVTVDGVTFRMRRNELMIARPCVVCGTGQYESPAINMQAELGYALSAWEPRCPHCEPVDPGDWLDRKD